jgi:hypothetical protein
MAAAGAIALAAAAAGVSPAEARPGAGTGNDRVQAVVIGSVNSPVLRHLRAQMGRDLVVHRARSGQDLARYDVVIVDGDSRRAHVWLARHPEVLDAVRDGQWLMTVDATAAQMMRALRRHAGIHAGARGARVHLMRRGMHDGRSLVRIVQQSGRHTPAGARHAARQVAVALRTGPGLGAAAEAAPPTELLNARYHFSEVSDGRTTYDGARGACRPVVGCIESTGERGRQTPNWVIDHTYDVFLDNGSTARTQGGFQWVGHRATVTFAPRQAGERWAQETVTADNVPSSYGLWAGATDFEVLRPVLSQSGPTIDLAAAAPGTANQTNSYRVANSQSFGFKVGAKASAETGSDGDSAGGDISASVDANWSWSFEREYSLTDWQTRRVGAARPGGVAWRFSALNPCDATRIGGVDSGAWVTVAPPENGCFAMDGNHPRAFGSRTNVVDGGPLEPNGLSSDASELGVFSLWRTSGLSRGTVQFPSKATFTLFGHACRAWFFGCTSHAIRKQAITLGSKHVIDLNAVVPVGIRSIRFYRRDSIRPGGTPVELDTVTPGVDLIGVVELRGPAPANLTLPVATDSSQVRVGDAVEIDAGERGPECLDDLARRAGTNPRALPEGACFLVVSSARQRGAGVEAAAIRVFYAESVVESLRVAPS